MRKSFVFKISPVPASRPRVGRYGVYYSKPYRVFKKAYEQVIEESLPKNWKPITGKVVIKKLHLICKQPKTTSLSYPKPDIDNLQKAVFDGCNGKVWVDDCQIQSLKGEVCKVWADPNEEGRIEMLIEW